MKSTQKFIWLSCLLGGLSIATTSFAQANFNSVKLFLSNNQGEISLPTAYTRLTSKPQQQLVASTIPILQVNHFEQGSFSNVLGAYQMSTDKNLTADNSEIFISSPLQKLPQHTVFKVAEQLAVKLKQDSVAAFIPNSKAQTIGDIEVYFANPPSIQQIINLVHNKLPSSYSTAFTLHLANEHAGFNQNKVTAIEWLGNNNINKIKAAFPKAKVVYQHGKAFLIYRNGKIVAL